MLLRRVSIRKTIPFVGAILFAAGFYFALPGFCFADTFNPGDQIVATFTAAPNTSDLLWFFNNDPLTLTGSPILTLTLMDGGTNLASIVAPPFAFGGQNFFQAYFQSPASSYANTAPPHATADFTSINNGTIAGMLIWTVSGGSISGFSMPDFILYDGQTVSANSFTPQGDISSTITLQVAPSPEASTLLLLVTGMALLGVVCLGKR